IRDRNVTGVQTCALPIFVGDGAWGMSLHEVSTAVEQNIPVIACVFNNHAWGAEKKNQVDYYNNRFVGSNIEGPNFAKVAEAMGRSEERRVGQEARCGWSA